MSGTTSRPKSAVQAPDSRARRLREIASRPILREIASRPILREIASRPILREAGIVVVAYLLYAQVRNLVDERVETAEQFAYWLLAIEKNLGIDVELGFNRWVAAYEPLAVGMNYYYAVLHFPVTIAVLVWLWRWRRGHYYLARTALMCGSVIGLMGFWLLPLAPPRLLPDAGYIDTFWYYDTWGSLSDPTMAELSNQYAAMPSLHVGWALWAGVVVYLLARHAWVRTVALLYPAVTVVIVVGTANHFVLDAVASVVVMAAGLGLALLVHRWPDTRQGRTTAVAVAAVSAMTLVWLVVVMRPPYDLPPPIPYIEAGTAADTG